jgi:hypothetical protein
MIQILKLLCDWKEYIMSRYLQMFQIYKMFTLNSVDIFADVSTLQRSILAH